jgi:acetyl esterase/lipase
MFRVMAVALVAALSAYVVSENAISHAENARVPALEASVRQGIVRDVQYSPISGQKLDIFYPGTPGPHPVVVWVHGGGWMNGSKEDGLPDYISEELSRNNFVGVSIDYRLSGWNELAQPVNPFPAAVDDVKTAVRFLKANSAEYQLQADAIFLGGISAGGHLAALAGTSAAMGLLEPTNLPADLAAQDSTVRAVIDVVGINSVEAWGENPLGYESTAAFLGCPRWVAGPSDCAPDVAAQASVSPYVSPAAPPAFLAYGTEDAFVPAEQHGAPLALQWAAAKGVQNVYYDEAAGVGHELDGTDIDRVRLHEFIDGVLAGVIR